MKALVTGGSGFIGAEVVSRLVARGDRVTVLRRATPRDRDRLAALDGRLEIVAGDARDRSALGRACKGVDVVYHLAFLYHRAWQLGEDLLAPNLKATELALQAAAVAGVQRFVLSGSVSVYGWTHPVWRWPLDEETPLLALGTYPETKIRSERLVRRFCQQHGIRTAILRLPHVYGRGASTFERFIAGLLQPGGRRSRRTDVDPTLEWGRVWHWVHVRDVADALVLAGTVPSLRSDTFNVAGPGGVTRRALGAIVGQLAGQADGDETARITEPRFQMYDIRRASEELGFTPRVALAEGLREIVRALQRWPAAA